MTRAALPGVYAALLAACGDGEVRGVAGAGSSGGGEHGAPAPAGADPAEGPPETTLEVVPERATTDRRARFEIGSDAPGARFECRVDQGPFLPCAAVTFAWSDRAGRHAFEARAIAGGRRDSTPAGHRWTVLPSTPHVAIVEATDGWRFDPEAGAFAVQDDARIARPIFDALPDAFDFAIVWSDFLVFDDEWSAYERTLAHDVEGIGTWVFESGEPARAGSAGRLQSFVFMNDAFAWEPWDPTFALALDVLSMEVGHRWLAYFHLPWEQDPGVLLDDCRCHWGLFTGLDVPSALSRTSAWTRDNGDGTFTAEPIARPAGFAGIDLYAIGLIGPEEVGDFFFVRAPHEFDPRTSGGLPWTASSHVASRVTFRGERVDVPMERLIAAHGPRVPPRGEAQTAFRMAFVLVAEPGRGARLDALEHLDRLRLAWEAHFHEATRGLATADTSL